MVNRSQPKCFIQNIDVVPSIPADDACQAEGQQLISQLPDMTVWILKLSIVHARCPPAKDAKDAAS